MTITVPPGELVEDIACLSDPSQTYTLYLPTSYTTDRQWPVLLIFDPRGLANQFLNFLANNPSPVDFKLLALPTMLSYLELRSWIGHSGGSYRLIRKVGEGGMGEVYRARDSFLKREVALKKIKPGLAEEHEVRARFLRECRAAAAISHPNVATIYEAGSCDDGSIYLASELIRGETLTRRLRRGRLSVDEQWDLGIQLTRGLAAAHEAGIVHRDIKPGNLMVTDDGRLKILDFGLARLNQPLGGQADDDGDTLTRTRPGHFLGTPAYMSPEQVTGAEVDATSDVFSCGCVLYEMVSGKAPFSAESVSETVRRILSEDPPDLDTLAQDDLPPGLVDIIRRALAKKPAERFADASEMAKALTAARDQTAPASVHEPETRPKRSRRVGIGVAAGAAIVAAALLSWIFGRSTLAFEKRDLLLITSVVNQTDEEAFDLALRTALEADLHRLIRHELGADHPDQRRERRRDALAHLGARSDDRDRAVGADDHIGIERRLALGEIVVEARDLKRHYEVGGGLFGGKGTVRALDGVDITIGQGEMLAVMGPSGSGKSTFVSLIPRLPMPARRARSGLELPLRLAAGGMRRREHRGHPDRLGRRAAVREADQRVGDRILAAHQCRRVGGRRSCRRLPSEGIGRSVVVPRRRDTGVV